LKRREFLLEPSWERLIAELDKLIPEQMEKRTVPGLSIAIIKDAKIAWREGSNRHSSARYLFSWTAGDAIRIGIGLELARVDSTSLPRSSPHSAWTCMPVLAKHPACSPSDPIWFARTIRRSQARPGSPSRSSANSPPRRAGRDTFFACEGRARPKH
jgi:hypothetical protein